MRTDREPSPKPWERALDRSHVASAQSRGPSPIVRTCLSGAAPRPRSPPWVRCQQPSQWGPAFDQVLRPGAVVASHCEALEAGSAAIIVHVASENDTLFPSTASVLELDWSGSTRPTIDDVASAAPLRLTHHDHTGRLSYCRHEAKLPRNYKVIGELPVPELERSNSFTPRWTVGQQLARQRRWDAGERSEDERAVRCTAEEFAAMGLPRAQSGSTPLCVTRRSSAPTLMA